MSCPYGVAVSTTNICDMYLWHRRLGHLNYNSLSRLKSSLTGISFTTSDKPTCQACIYGKLCKNPFPPNHERASNILGLIHTDLCQADTLSLNKFKYFLTFIDDCSRTIFVYFLKKKSDFNTCIK